MFCARLSGSGSLFECSWSSPSLTVVELKVATERLTLLSVSQVNQGEVV